MPPLVRAHESYTRSGISEPAVIGRSPPRPAARASSASATHFLEATQQGQPRGALMGD